jgi:hypothetical protein
MMKGSSGQVTRVAPSFEEGGDVDGFMEMFTDFTKGEDGAVIENIQRNIRNPRFQVGPITQSYERAISNFHDAYLEFVK